MSIQGEGRYFTLRRFKGDGADVSRQWLEARREGVGGSDVAAIMGLSPWRTPYMCWADKVLGVHEDISAKPSVQWGNILEPVVGEHFARLHPDFKVRRVNGIAASVERPWAQASLDYEVRVPGRDFGVLEIKTAGLRSADEWAEGVPLFYATQVAHYLSVLNRRYAYVAVLIGGSDYREYLIERDEDDIAAVNAAVDEFWHRNVLGKVEPEPTGMDNSALFRTHRTAGEMRELPDTPALVGRWRVAKSQLDDAKKRVDELSAQLRQQIGDAGGWETPDGRLKWVRSKASRLDTKRLCEDHPEIRDEYTVVTERDGGLRWTARRE